jgi:hypothetical protein
VKTEIRSIKMELKVPRYGTAGHVKMLMHIEEAGMKYKLKVCEKKRKCQMSVTWS